MKSDVLLTGFEPFGGDPRNPSSEACALLDGSDIRGYRVRTLCLPTAFNAAAMQLLREITRNPPALVIATGVAGGRAEITPERFAMNFSDARIPDNRRRQPRERTIVRGAPLAYMSTLPVTRIVEKLRDAGIPAAPSLSAGDTHPRVDPPPAPAGVVVVPEMRPRLAPAPPYEPLHSSAVSRAVTSIV